MTTVTSILSTDLISDSRSVINNSFQAINVGKAETTSLIGYTLFATGSSLNPADSLTYYFGGIPTPATTTSALARLYIPKAGTVKAIYLAFKVAAVLGSSESSTFNFRLNDTTSTLISSAVTFTATFTNFSNTSMSVAVVAGDYFEIEWVCPAWATNPTTVFPTAVVYIE